MFLLIIQPLPIVGLLLRDTVHFSGLSIWLTGAMSGKEFNL